MEIRPLTADDRRALDVFASRIPEADLVFADPTLLSPIAVASWTRAVPAKRLVAFDEPDVVALLTVQPEVGWSDHVGDVRLIVLPDHRGRGIGRTLAQRGLELAESLGLAKLMVRLMDGNAGGIAMFRALGFEEEARLAGHVRDRAGGARDLVILSRWL